MFLFLCFALQNHLQYHHIVVLQYIFSNRIRRISKLLVHLYCLTTLFRTSSQRVEHSTKCILHANQHHILCPKCRSLHKTIMVITVRAHCYPLDIYIYTKILEVNLFAFAYRLFHRDFSAINGTYCMGTHFFSSFICILY